MLNIRQARPNIPLAPDADPGDGLLDAVFVRAADADALAGYVQARLAGSEPDPPRLDLRRGREIAVRPPTDAALHLDDEIIGRPGDRTTADRLVLRTAAALDVLVPPGAEPE